MTDPVTRTLEVDLVIEAAWRRYGLDFRGYSRASLERRLRNICDRENLAEIGELIPRMLHDAGFIDRFVNGISVNVTEPFRDPEVFQSIREHLFPYLRTFPYFKIWHAGCASGEEVYSLAILLHEAGLLERAQIYATDINTKALTMARDGIFPEQTLIKAEASYRKAGGNATLADYYTVQYGAGRFKSFLRKYMIFSQHNLVTDGPFGEMAAILCRNVLIYFDRELQERAVRLFRHSLGVRGYLILGSKESLKHSAAGGEFEEVRHEHRIYRSR